MKLTKEDIEKNEEVGTAKKGKVMCITTKGGLSLIVTKSLGGALDIVATAPHPGIARFKAEQMDPSIQWTEGLFKSETQGEYLSQKMKTVHIDLETLSKAADPHAALEGLSTPENHYKMAQHHSHLAGRVATTPKTGDTAQDHDRNMKILMHTNDALKHYQMAGLNGQQMKAEHEKNMASHASIDPNFKMPASTDDMVMAYTRKKRKEGIEPEHVSGLGNRWSE
jgi:hypothetical protein